MVAKIESGKSLIGALNYNERKVKAGKAELIYAQLFQKDIQTLSFDEKLFRLTDLAARNHRTKTNTVHLSLNFDLSEHIPTPTLCEIAQSYMERIGFGEQPFLVYKHFDAGHDHIHVLTTNINSSGNRISLHNIGKLKSEPARKACELEFGLVRAGDQHKSMAIDKQIKPLIYGTTDTKRTISNIVNYIIQTYKFTSLHEFNAVLASFNIVADRGPKETTMYQNGGLRYWALDGICNKIGVPIKASSIHKKPTLKLLEKRFQLNAYLRKSHKENMINGLEKALSQADSIRDLKEILANISIDLVLRENPEGRIYGLTFVYHHNKVVFNGSDLGKGYSATALNHRLLDNAQSLPTSKITTAKSFDGANTPQGITESIPMRSGILDDLLTPVNQSLSPNLFERKKRKKRKRLNL